MSHTASIFNFGRVVHDHDWNFIVPGSVFWRMYRVISGEAEVFIYGNVHRIKSGYLYMIHLHKPENDSSGLWPI